MTQATPPRDLDALLRLAANELPQGQYISIMAGDKGIYVRLWIGNNEGYSAWPERYELPATEQVAFILKEEGVLLTETED